MATYKYFDFTLRTSFPKEGNEACSRILSTSTALTALEKITKKTGLEAVYTVCQSLTGNVTADTVIVCKYSKQKEQY